ncbi:MAG: hypothetical protein ACE5E8_04680 [Acidimicrobiia bacterium]
MEIMLLVVLGGVWLLFLLPKFLAADRSPVHSTEAFARKSAKLGALSAATARRSSVANRRTRARRRRVLVALVVVGVLTFTAAVATGSWALLFVNLVVDAMFATYVALLLQLRERSHPAGRSSLRRGGRRRPEDAEALAR